MNRNKEIIKTSYIGIAANLLLSVFKLAVGLISNSVSILIDAVNNIADGLSSALTIIGAKLSEKEPDRKHPFGYGRVEYLVSMVIGFIISYAGIQALINSVERIIHPEEADFSLTTIIILIGALIIKILVGLYTKKQGEKLDSHALKASGEEALGDALTSVATLVAALIYMTTGKNIEAYVGVLISLLIIKTGFETVRETADIILGKSSDLEIVNKIKEAIRSFADVEGVYDVVIHNYGNDKLMASAHIEVSDKYTTAWIDNLERALTRKVLEDTGVILTGISVYAINSDSYEVVKARDDVRKIVMDTPGTNNMHGFYIDLIDKSMNFDVVLDFGSCSKDSLVEEIQKEVHKLYPDYDVKITVDYNFSEN